MTSLAIIDEAAWHGIRHRHVGASEVAALFGLSPWLTKWQLWMIKTGRLPPVDLSENTAVRSGKHFEPAIAAYAQEKFGITLRKVRRYLSDDTISGCGASLDYEQIGTGELIPTEIKWSVFGAGWDYEGSDLTEAPDYYMLQCQQQMACGGASQAQLFAYIDGDVRRMVIPRSEPLIAAIRDRIRAFWESVSAGDEPPVDFNLDADAISRMAALNPLVSVDWEKDARARELAEAYVVAGREEKAAGERKEAARAEMLKRLLDAATEQGADTDSQSMKVQIAGYRMSVSLVGQSVVPSFTRKAYRRMTISEPKITHAQEK